MKPLRAAIVAIGTLLGIVGSVIAIVYAPRSFWDWWWRPGPMTALLGATILALVAWIVVLHRSASTTLPSTYDQASLDRVLEVLPRSVITYWRETDALGGWRADRSEAVARYANFRNEIEDRFRDAEMEKKRQALHRAASEFAILDAGHGSPANPDGWRDVGTSASALDFMVEGPDRERYVTSGRLINDAADRVVDAYDDLLKTAAERRYDVRHASA